MVAAPNPDTPVADSPIEGMSWEDFNRRWDEVGPFALIDGEIIDMGTNLALHTFVINILVTHLTLYFANNHIEGVYGSAHSVFG